MKILVLGATGYVGFPICQSLRRDNHEVYGLARSNEKAVVLRRQEIRAIIGTVEGSEYLDKVREANIDLVIDASGANQGSTKILHDLSTLSAERLAKRGPLGPKLQFIYVSGAWVHGSSLQSVSDLNPAGLPDDAGCPTPPPTLVAWRPELERAILGARDVLDSVIVRPGLVYGGQNGLWSLWLQPIHAATSSSSSTTKVHLAADVTARPGLVHIDDIVSAIHAIASKHALVSTASGVYPVFDIVASSERLQAILESAARVLGFNGSLIYDGPGDNIFAQAMNASINSSSTRLRDLLGWTAKRLCMEDGIEEYVAAWAAHLPS